MNRRFSAWYGTLWLKQFSEEFTEDLIGEWFKALGSLSVIQIEKVFEFLEKGGTPHDRYPPSMIEFRQIAASIPVSAEEDSNLRDKELKHEIWLAINGFIADWERWKRILSNRNDKTVSYHLLLVAQAGYKKLQEFKKIIDDEPNLPLSEEILKKIRRVYYREIWEHLAEPVRQAIIDDKDLSAFKEGEHYVTK